MIAIRGTAEFRKFGCVSEIATIITWGKTTVVHMEYVEHRSLTETMNCAVVHVEEFFLWFF